MIHELLGTDPLTGWTIPQLKRRLGIESKYSILAQIDRERRQGYPICHTRHIWRRYYLADSKYSFVSFLGRFKADTNREARGLAYCEEILRNWDKKKR